MTWEQATFTSNSPGVSSFIALIGHLNMHPEIKSVNVLHSDHKETRALIGELRDV